MTWGQTPTRGTVPKRDVPYLPYSNSKIKRFAPLADKDYTMTIITKNGWQEPVEIWTHTVSKNGTFFGQFFSRNVRPGDNNCPFAYANQQQLERNGGMPIENKNRVYPLGKRFVFPVVVDEVPNEQFMMYMVSERELTKLIKSFQIANKPVHEYKLKISRTGSGAQDTSYMYTVTGEPVNKQMLEKLNIPAITPDNYKEFLIGLENPYASELGLNLKSPQNNENSGTSQFSSNTNIDTNSSNSNNKGAAANFIIEFGPFAGKKLGELDMDTLQIIADSMDGEIQAYAVELLNKNSSF